MKRLATLFTIVGLVGVFTVFASEKNPPNETFFAGVVVSVNASANTLTVHEAGLAGDQMRERTLTFAVEPQAQIAEKKSSFRLSEIKRGDPVELEFTRQGNRNVTDWIRVLTKPS